MSIDVAPALFGLLVGFLVGLTGVGGGSLMTPFLVGASLIFREYFMPRRTEDSGYGPSKPNTWNGKGPMSRRRRVYTVIFGAMGGYLVGLTSIGSGSIMAVILPLPFPQSPPHLLRHDIAPPP